MAAGVCCGATGCGFLNASTSATTEMRSVAKLKMRPNRIFPGRSGLYRISIFFPPDNASQYVSISDRPIYAKRVGEKQPDSQLERSFGELKHVPCQGRLRNAPRARLEITEVQAGSGEGPWGDRGSGSRRLRRCNQRSHVAFDRMQELLLSDFQLIGSLGVKPESCAGIEVTSQAQCSLGGDPAAPVDNLGNPRDRHVKFERQLIHAQAERRHEILAKDFAGMNRRQKLRLGHVHL